MVGKLSRRIQQMCSSIHRQTMRGGPEVGFLSPRAYDQLMEEPGSVEISTGLLVWCNRVYFHRHKDWDTPMGLDVRLVWPGNRLRYTYITPEENPEFDDLPEGVKKLEIPEVHLEMVPDVGPDIVEECEFSKDEWEAILND